MTKDEATELVQKVEALRAKDGISVKDACHDLGKHFTFFYKAKQLLGLPHIRDVRRAEQAQQFNEVQKLVQGGMSHVEALQKTGLSESAYYRCLHRHEKPVANSNHRGGKTSGSGMIYRIGATITSDSTGRLHSRCPICDWQANAQTPRELNNLMNRHYRLKHPKQYPGKNSVQEVPEVDKPFMRDERRLESFGCPHCGNTIVVRHEGELEVFSKVNLNNNSNE